MLERPVLGEGSSDVDVQPLLELGLANVVIHVVARTGSPAMAPGMDTGSGAPLGQLLWPRGEGIGHVFPFGHCTVR